MSKKKYILLTIIVIFFVLLLTTVIIWLTMPKFTNIEIINFIDNYNKLLQENIDKDINIKYPKKTQKEEVTYWIPIDNKIELGIITDNNKDTLNLKKDKVIVSSLRYSNNISNYKKINKYLYYLIMVNNNNLTDSKINNLIKQIRNNSDKEITTDHLIISHSKSEYQIDSIGTYTR